MKRLSIAVVTTFALAGAALAAEQGASSKAPGQQMQEKGSVPGSPGASGYAPGQEKKSDTTGSTSGSGQSRDMSSGNSGSPTRR
ncbi:hypothetical protein [Methylobacterium iners]|uniref:Lipoprotein n=1 Tax=Methylobacterium iners TaxID=418707 RepID=A0ABQ4RS27_9HYPH|nr:hypothetical protein [Methylobacterium iners]GJD93581.1 hypothetical protein OCOJLMKI_0777 [Methylobacterium iners]